LAMVGLRTVSVSRFGIPAYRPTLPMRIPIGTHRDMVVVGVRTVPTEVLISIDRTEQRRYDRGFYQQTFQSMIVVGLLTNFVACQGFEDMLI
jgi:hypothetical protein